MFVSSWLPSNHWIDTNCFRNNDSGNGYLLPINYSNAFAIVCRKQLSTFILIQLPLTLTYMDC